HHRADARADIRPDLHPDVAGRSAERPRVLLTECVASIAVVAQERQLRAPRHPHREARRHQDPYGRLQALWPGIHRSERGGRPIDTQKIAAEVAQTREQSAESSLLMAGSIR